MCNNLVVFLSTKTFFLIMIYEADTAILKSDFDNDQISSKSAQRYQMKPQRCQMKPFQESPNTK